MADLKFIIELQDKVSAIADKVNAAINVTKTKLNETTAAATAMGPKVSAAFTGISSKAREAVKGPEFLKNSIDELKTKLNEVNSARFGTVITSEFKAATKEAKALEAQISKLEKGISSAGIGGKIAGWRSDFANSLPGINLIKNPLTLAGAAMGGFWAATSKAMDAGKEKIKLQTLTGSAEIGTALYDGLTKFATDTVFGDELYDIGAQMLAYGINAESVLPVMKELGDISMGDSQKLGSLALAFGQIESKGHLAGQELMQLINAGFNPLQIISKETGESMESLREKMSKGEISIDKVRESMQMATGPGGDFHDMLNNIANTPYGKLENLRGELSVMMAKIGDVFMPIAEGFMDFLIWLNKNAAPFIKPLVVIIAALSAGLLVAAAAQWVLNLAMWSNPLTYTIMIIVALIAAIAWLVTSITGWGEQWQNIIAYATDSWQVFKLQFTLIGQQIGHSFMTMIDGLVKAWKWGMNKLGQLSDEQYAKDIARINNEGAIRKQKLQETINELQDKVNGATPLEMKLGFKAKDGSKTSQETLLEQATKNSKGTTPSGMNEGVKTNTAIATGGSKNTTINLSLKSLIEVLNINSANLKEGVNEMETQSTDALLRVLAMANLAAE